MTRETASNCYRRTKNWERNATRRLLADMCARGACDPIPLTLHNWGRCGGKEPFQTLDREYRHRQQAIYERASRLGAAFARYF